MKMARSSQEGINRLELDRALAAFPEPEQNSETQR